MTTADTGAEGAPAPPISEGGTIEQTSRDDIFFAAVEATRMPMVIVDPRKPDMPIVFCNPAFQQMTGYGEGEVLGRNCRFLQGPDTDRTTLDQIRVAISELREIQVEILNYKKDGTAFWNALFMSPVVNTEGELLYFFGSQMDVTPRREAERALQQSQRMDAIGQLTGGVAHDFNNLLQVISGGAEALRRRPADTPIGELQAILGAIEAAASRGAKLTAQLLSFARRQHLAGRKLDLQMIIEGAMPLIEQSVGDEIRIIIDQCCEPCCVNVDPSQAEVALHNIVLNARDAMGARGTLRIETERKQMGREAVISGLLEPGDYAMISVTDSGPGMPSKVLERATDPFFTTKSPTAATGLGLSMVIGFLQQSKGGLAISSAPGDGTTVRMYFPIAGSETEPIPGRRD